MTIVADILGPMATTLMVWIDQDLCTGDGICSEICPDVFVGRDDGLWVVKEEASHFGSTIVFDGVDGAGHGPDGGKGVAQIPDSLIDSAVEAAEECPGECIMIEPYDQAAIDDADDADRMARLLDDSSRWARGVRRGSGAASPAGTGAGSAAQMPSETSKWRCGSSSQVARRGGGDPPRQGHRRGHAVARRLVQADDDVATAVVGDLDGVDLDAAPRHRHHRRRQLRRRTVARPTLDDPQRQVEPLRLGDDVGEAGAVREQRQRHGVVAVVGVGVGVLRRPGEADAPLNPHRPDRANRPWP